MDIIIKKLTDDDLMIAACESTIHGKSKISFDKMCKCMHSPLRTRLYWIQMIDIPTFVSVHFVRHKIGCEHFVLSMRDDRSGIDNNETNRLTPINHSMLINAEALINMSHKRLCYQTHKDTREVMILIKEKIKEIEPDIYKYLIPQCFYRGMICSELKPCGNYKIKNNLEFNL